MMPFVNREGHTRYNILQRFWTNRKPGLSMMLRIKNEEEWIRYSILSICKWADEIVVVFQNSTDLSEQIVRELNLSTIKIYQYPFDSYKHGVGFNSHPEDSVFSQAYYYNWCLSKTTREWVCKWDGDMVAMDWLGNQVHKHMANKDLITIRGINLAGDIYHVGKDEFTANEPRFFKVGNDTYYYSGKYTQCFKFPPKYKRVHIRRPSFLHFKWVKALESATKIWPTDYNNIPLFQNLLKRRIPITVYSGEYPQVLTGLFKNERT